jgi:hypothetical protein
MHTAARGASRAPDSDAPPMEAARPLRLMLVDDFPPRAAV